MSGEAMRQIHIAVYGVQVAILLLVVNSASGFQFQGYQWSSYYQDGNVVPSEINIETKANGAN